MAKKLALTAGALVALLCLAVGVLFARAAATDRAMEAAWRNELGGLSFPERYPATEDNATALELERLGAAIGLRAATGTTPARPQPTPEAEERFGAIKGALKQRVEPAGSRLDAGPATPSENLEAFLADHRSALDAMADCLLTGPPPVWRSNLAVGSAAPVPNLLAVLHTGRLLVAEAWWSFEQGQPERGERFLEASWRLTQAVLERPELFCQMIGLNLFKIELGVLAAQPELPPLWAGRLSQLELHRGVRRAFLLDSFMFHWEGRGNGSESEEIGAFLRWAYRDFARRLYRIAEEAARIPPQDFDPDGFFAEQMEAIPRWHTPARVLLPGSWNSWPQAGHGELAAELVLLREEERRRLAAEGARSAPSFRPTRLAGLEWRFDPVPEGTRITLDGEYKHPGLAPLPLQVVAPNETSAQPPGRRLREGAGAQPPSETPTSPPSPLPRP